MRPELTNEERPYLGLRPVLPHWQRAEWSPGVVVYHDGLGIRKLIGYFESPGPEAFYEEDHDIAFTPDGQLRTVSGRGKPRPATWASLEKYRPTGYRFFYDGAHSFFTEARNGAITPFKARGDYPTWAAAAQWLAGFIARRGADYPQQLLAQLAAPIPRVSYRPGDIIAFPLRNDAGYGFCRILLDVNALRTTAWVPDPANQSGYHYLRRYASPLAMGEVLKLQKPTPTLSPAEISQVARTPPILLGDAYIRCGFLPIVAHESLAAADLTNLPRAFEPLYRYGPRGYYYQWGTAVVAIPLDEELQTQYEALAQAFPTLDRPLAHFEPAGQFFYEAGQFESVGAWQEAGGLAPFDLRHPRYHDLHASIMRRLGLPADVSFDEFSRHFGFPTRQELVDWQATQPPSPDEWKWRW